MKKITLIAPLLMAGLALSGCRKTDNDKTYSLIPPPVITVKTIWLTDPKGVVTSYDPQVIQDTITVDATSEVKIDYTVDSESDLLLVGNYYVSGTAGSQLATSMTRAQLEESNALYHYEGQLQCSGFLPFQCAFRIAAANRYGGTDSKKGFFLKLPAKSLRDYDSTPATTNHDNRNFGPAQGDANCPSLGKCINSVRWGGRYTPYDMANGKERAGSNDYGINFVNVTEDGKTVRKVVLFSPSAFNKVYPESAASAAKPTEFTIQYGAGVTPADNTVTKFYRLDLFTASMWADLNSIPRLNALAASFKNLCQDDVVYVNSAGFYFFSATSTSYPPGWYGVLYVKNLAYQTTNGLPSAVQLDMRTFRYWP